MTETQRPLASASGSSHRDPFGLFPPVLSPDISGNPEGSDSQGGGTLDDHDDLSDQSEVESYSYSGPGGEPLSRDPSEPLFDADFQVGPPGIS